MAIVAECAVCGKRFKADEKQAGKKAKCSQCGTVFVIGGAIPSPDLSAAASAPTRPAANKAVAAMGAPSVADRPATTGHPAPDNFDLPAPQSLRPTHVAATPIPKPGPADLGPIANLPDPTLPSSPVPHSHHRRKHKRKRAVGIALVASLVVAIGGVSAVVVPKLLNARATGGPNPAANAVTNPNNSGAQLVSHVIAPGITSTGPAWSVQPDVPAAPLKLPENFRLAIPAQIPFRHNPGSLVLAARPSPFAAITLLPDAESAQPAVEVWNLAADSSQARVATFKLNPEQKLMHPVLSQDGGYYAGHWFDANARVNHVEVWSVPNGTRNHVIDVPVATAINAPVVLGFPFEGQITIFGDKVQVWDLNSKQPVDEVALPSPRAEDTRAAASAKLKLVAVADARSLCLIDLSQKKLLGQAPIPDAVVAHPRKRLTLRAIEFSPDGTELALAFDNRQSTRRIAIYDVATGVLKALLTPTAPVLPGGPELQWAADGRGFLVGGGILLDRATGRQNGQIYGDLADEGLGGIVAGLVDDRSMLLLWDKYPVSLVVRAVPAPRERQDWVKVNLRAATATRYETLQCVSSLFGNVTGSQSLLQTGRLTDGTQFLVVDLDFTATLADDAPPLLPLRQDQFVLLADGHPRLPIGIMTRDGNFSLEKPEYDLRKGDKTPRKRAVVFAVTGNEKSLAIRVASAEHPLTPPAQPVAPPTPSLVPVAAERLPSSLFNAPDAAAAVTVRVTSARVRPFEFDPDAADHVPLRVTYNAPYNVLGVTFDLTVNTPRNGSANGRGERPKFGLLLPDGTHVHPSVELPGMLPAVLGAGERRTHTCLFIVDSPTSKFRLTYDGTPVATITPETQTAQSTP